MLPVLKMERQHLAGLPAGSQRSIFILRGAASPHI
jgi:hypothetical protein